MARLHNAHIYMNHLCKIYLFDPLNATRIDFYNRKTIGSMQRLDLNVISDEYDESI